MFHRMGCQIKNFRAIFQLSFDGYGVIILNAVGTADADFPLRIKIHSQG